MWRTNQNPAKKSIVPSFCENRIVRKEKVRKRTIANLSNCAHKEIEAIKLALSHKEDLSALGALSEDNREDD